MSEDNRKIIDNFLAEIGASVGKNIRLNDQGISAFTYEDLTIVIEVPETIPSFFVYTKLTSLGQSKNENALMKKLLQLNYLQQETRGGCISLDPMNDEVMFSYSDRVAEVQATDFRNILENFIDTALTLVKAVDAIENSNPVQASTSAPHMGMTGSMGSNQQFNPPSQPAAAPASAPVESDEDRRRREAEMAIKNKFNFGGGHISP